MADFLVIPASLLGKARTADQQIFEVTLKIQRDVLNLRLTPEQAQIFPDLNSLEGGGHPLYDPTRVVYHHTTPQYRVIIEPILTDTVPMREVAVSVTPGPELVPEAAQPAEPLTAQPVESPATPHHMS